MNRTFSFLAGAFCGALIGATVALLLAPEAGADVRERTRTRLQDMLDEVRAAGSDRRAELEEQLAQLRAIRPAE